MHFHSLQTLYQFCAYPLRVGAFRLLFDLQRELAPTRLKLEDLLVALAKKRRGA
jgi:hypothetical protein